MFHYTKDKLISLFKKFQTRKNRLYIFDIMKCCLIRLRGKECYGDAVGSVGGTDFVSLWPGVALDGTPLVLLRAAFRSPCYGSTLSLRRCYGMIKLMQVFLFFGFQPFMLEVDL